MNWTRFALGSRGSHLGRSRWPLTTVIATAGGIYAAVGGLWTQAAIFFGAAVVLGGLTFWSYRK
ncbi:MAG: hypothetical protein M3540_09720 [Actinomycetota bacterium]|nr:hypothetical protein [Actinomycetota bacterium]